MINAKELLKLRNWVVVGASENKEKFGYKIYKRLKDAGYNVLPVNPNYDAILGDKCYPSLTELPHKPDVINMVVSPKHGMKTVDQAAELGIRYIWFQPSSYNQEILDFAHGKGLETIEACILRELSNT